MLLKYLSVYPLPSQQKEIVTDMPVHALIIKVIVSVQQQYKLIIVILYQCWVFVKCFESIRRMSQMVPLAVISYLKEIYNIWKILF